MKKYLFAAVTALLAICCTKTIAQNARFLSQGRIEFERKVSLWAQLDEITDETWRELEKKSTPQFKLSYFDLQFNGTKTLYKPGRDNPDNNRMRAEPVEDNVVYTDLDNLQATTQKNVFELTFLVQDSARHIKWKITNETRNIAGFDCRRANALINDSIFVVAFYTDAITTPGGPESFCGLPGMILGVALPHEHITWFATKVYAEPVPAAALAAPSKGKKTDNRHLIENLKDILKDWGNWGQWYVRRIAI
jgi:GLPGLI family protein